MALDVLHHLLFFIWFFFSVHFFFFSGKCRHFHNMVASTVVKQLRSFWFYSWKKKHEIVAIDVLCVLQVINHVSLFSDICPTIKWHCVGFCKVCPLRLHSAHSCSCTRYFQYVRSNLFPFPFSYLIFMW